MISPPILFRYTRSLLMGLLVVRLTGVRLNERLVNESPDTRDRVYLQTSKNAITVPLFFQKLQWPIALYLQFLFINKDH